MLGPAVDEWVWPVDVEVGLVAVEGDLNSNKLSIFREEKREEIKLSVHCAYVCAYFFSAAFP